MKSSLCPQHPEGVLWDSDLTEDPQAPKDCGFPRGPTAHFLGRPVTWSSARACLPEHACAHARSAAAAFRSRPQSDPSTGQDKDEPLTPLSPSPPLSFCPFSFLLLLPTGPGPEDGHGGAMEDTTQAEFPRGSWGHGPPGCVQREAHQ